MHKTKLSITALSFETVSSTVSVPSSTQDWLGVAYGTYPPPDSHQCKAGKHVAVVLLLCIAGWVAERVNWRNLRWDFHGKFIHSVELERSLVNACCFG